MFPKVKTRFALGAITAIMAIPGASTLGMGAAHSTHAAAVKTASMTDVVSGLRSDAGVQTYNLINAWPKKYTGVG